MDADEERGDARGAKHEAPVEASGAGARGDEVECDIDEVAEGDSEGGPHLPWERAKRGVRKVCFAGEREGISGNAGEWGGLNRTYTSSLTLPG